MKVNATTLAVTASTAAIIGLFAAGAASAQTTGASLVDKIATQFNLNKADVQKVFDEDRASHRVQHEARYEERLTQAVKAGKLTEDQKSKIIAKHKELEAAMEKDREAMKAERQSLDTKNDAERQTLREQKRADMDKRKADIEAWEKANNIPAGYLMGGKGFGHGPGFGHGGPR